MKTDEKILELQAKVEAKRAKIKSTERPQWRTNMNFPYQGTTKNINTVINKADLVVYFGYLISLNQEGEAAMKLLEIDDFRLTHGGFSFEDWTHDFKLRAAIIGVNEEKKKLAKIEETLRSLESSELKTARLLAEIENEIS